MKKTTKLVLLGFVFFAISCTNTDPKGGENDDNEEETELTLEQESEQTLAVINEHLKAFGSNDIEAVMAHYTEETVVISRDSMYTGLTELRAFFEGLLPAFPTEGTVFNVEKLVAYGEVGYLVWNATTPVLNVSLGSDTYIVEDGKIETQTFVGVMTPVIAEAAGEGAAAE